MRRPPWRIGRHWPSCHLCKLLQRRAEVKRSTCVASINRIARSLVEFLLKSLVAGSVFLTPQVPSGRQLWLCLTLGAEWACADGGGSPIMVMGGQGHQAPLVSSLWDKWERLRCYLQEWSLEGLQPWRSSLLVGLGICSPPSLLQTPSAPILEPSRGVAAPTFGPQPYPAPLRHPSIPLRPAH